MTGNEAQANQTETTHLEVATLGGGCFWCIEAVFEELTGVTSAVSGYAGGRGGTPSYEEVCSGESGHAEVVRVTFDPAVISFQEILVVFFSVHDPTTLNRQGADVGTQYRSVIFCNDDQQRQTADRVIAQMKADEIWTRPVVTEVVGPSRFYKAESYHQDYFRRNPNQSYCRVVINPKLSKFRQTFADRLKTAP